MKKSVALKILSIISLLFLSCSNNQTLKVSYQDTETLKEILKEKESETRWALELEPDKLSESLDIDSKIVSKEVIKDNKTVKILKEFQTPVYANVENFGNLDATILTDTQKSTIDDFMTHISTKINEDAGEYFVEGYKFNYKFFYNDLNQIWKNSYKSDFTEKLFKKWLIGEPVKYENEIIIPVRAYTEKGYLNFLIYTNNDVTIKIYNVQIENVGGN